MFFKKLFSVFTKPSVKKLNRQCERLAEGPKNSTNIEKRTRVRAVLKTKNDILKELDLDRSSSLKQEIAKQAIKLVIEYLRLIEIYYSKLASVDHRILQQLKDRIEQNKQKLNVSESEQIAELNATIEVDERLVLNSKVEEEEFEKLDLKLKRIESSITLFNHQIKDDIYLDDSGDNVDMIINEAIARDNVINKNNRDKNRV